MSNPRVSVIWNGVVFVLSTNIDGTSTYKYSTDGYSWETAETPAVIANDATNVKWVGNRMMVLGNLSTASGNVSLTSLDGIHYGTTNPINTGGQLYDIETNTECRHTLRFPSRVMLSLGNSMAEHTETISYSTDGGNSWNLSASAGIFSESANDAKWNGRIWVAVGSGNANTIATSSNGVDWIGRGRTIFPEQATGIDWSKELWVATGTGETPVAYSIDGIHWLNSPIDGITAGTSVRWNGSIWVMSGIPANSGKSIAYSINGKQWTSVPNMFSVKATRIEWDGGLWSVYGEDPSWNIATSSDGMEWKKGYIESLVVDDELALYDDTQWWKSDNGNTYSVSIDRATWTTYSTTTDMSLSTVRRFAINQSNEATATIFPLSIATGEGENTIAYSNDGIYWVGLGETVFSQRANNAIWNGTLWVAVGKGGCWVATSYDGLEWTPRDSAIMTEGYDIAWNGAQFVAVGEGSATMAISADGIHWNSIPTNLFTQRASKVCWTGTAWLVYGSGTNTTAMSIDGVEWTPTPERNAVIFDASSVYWDASFVAVASTGDASYAFNHTIASGWQSATNTYVDTTGAYAGSNSTLYTGLDSITQTAYGEWIQLTIPSPATPKYYSISFSTNTTPREWILLGSTNGTDWREIHSFAFQPSTPPDEAFTMPINIYDNSFAYSVYRCVVKSTFGGIYTDIADLDFFMENAQSLSISRYETPVVLRNQVLFFSRITSFSGVRPAIYRMADLSLASQVSAPVRAGHYIHPSVDSATTLTSVCFDGEHAFLTDLSGAVAVFSNDSLNTNLVSSGIDSRLSSIYASCWNHRFVLFAGAGGISYGRIGTDWNLTNASELFTNVYGVSSNSGFGYVRANNVLYLHADDVLRVVAPKAPVVASIHFNLRNSNKHL